MKACGVIVEYNPFHNGHLYHGEMARKKSGAEVVIAVMSGNFLQRGEPGIIDKWKRTEAALANGIDLVIELPVEWALQPADFFAEGAIAILQALGCESLCFGTDSQEAFDYARFGSFVTRENEGINQYFQQLDRPDLSYPEKMAQVMAHFLPELDQNQSGPNHILGLSYSEANSRYPKPMTLLPIERIQASYHSKEIVGAIASATAIRQGLAEKKEISGVVPPQTVASLKSYQMSWESFWPYLKYQLTVSTVKELQGIYQMTEGIEYRLKEGSKTATSFNEFLQKVQTKRYTRTRIQRLCCYVLLGITQKEVMQAWDKKHLRILGFNERGKAYLKEQKKTCPFPILSKIGKKESRLYPLGIRSDGIYQLGNQAIEEQNFGRSPLQR